MIKLLVVDDSALMRRFLGEIFHREGDFEVAFARNGVEALKQLGEFQPDVVTLDVNMPQMDGLICLDRIMLERPCPVVMVSSLTEAGAEVTLEAMELGAVDFVAKPEGTISLAVDELTPLLIDKVRAASKAKLRSSHRLVERLKLRAKGSIAPARRMVTAPAALDETPPSIVPGPVDGVVLVGTSTGGPPALETLLSALPADFQWPILVAQHMPSIFTGSLARRLDRLCALQVIEATKPVPIAPGNVYIGKGDADIVVALRPGGPVVMAVPASGDYRWHPSVDRLVESAIRHLGASRLIGVLMTGMGYDGAQTMTLLRNAGGRTIAEAEETAVVWGMPGELVKAGGAEIVVPLGDIARQLLDWVP